jgi:hypothetical protein
MLGSNPGLLQLVHWLSDALTTRLDLFRCYITRVHTNVYIFTFFFKFLGRRQSHTDEHKHVIMLYQHTILCTGTFLFVRYSFLLISNKFCNLSLLNWVGGGQCGKKNLLHYPPPLPIFNTFTTGAKLIDRKTQNLQNTEYRIWNTEYRILNTEYRIQIAIFQNFSSL